MTREYSPSEVESISQQVNILAASSIFAQTERLVQFLRYVVEETLAGNGEQINQYALAMELYNRDESFDPATDSIVRVDAGRLRTKLREYYDTDGQTDSVQFELPKGKYTVKIHLDSTVSGNRSSEKIADINSTIDTSAKTIPTTPGKFSIVVLPLEVYSQDSQDQELADGITTEIIDELGRAAVEVVSRRSAFVYKGQNKDARDVGRELGVNYVLEGSLRKAGNRVRVAVALIDAHNGRQIWSETYDREIGDLFELQDAIGSAIAAVLGGALWRAATEGAQHVPSENLDAAGLVHRAAQFTFIYSQRIFEEGEQLANRALELDPDLGHAYTLIAFFLAHKVVNCWTDRPEEVRQEALAAADRALELAPNDSWVLSWNAELLGFMGEPQKAVSLMEHALTLEPGNLINKGFLGCALARVGRAEEGLAHIETAFELSPRDHYGPPWHVYSSWAYAQLGRYEEAEEAAHNAIEIVGTVPLMWMAYINALAKNGKLEEAQTALAELRSLCPQLTLEHQEWIFNMAFEPEKVAECHLSGLRKLDWS